MGLWRSIKASPKRRCEIAICGLFIFFNFTPCSACPRQRWFAVLFSPVMELFTLHGVLLVLAALNGWGRLSPSGGETGLLVSFHPPPPQTHFFRGERCPRMECILLESAYHGLVKQWYKVNNRHFFPHEFYWWKSKKMGLLVLILFKLGVGTDSFAIFFSSSPNEGTYC